MSRYDRLTRQQADSYLTPVIIAYYEANGGLDALLDRVTWIYEDDNKITIQLAPEGKINEARTGSLGCCRGGGQDYWALETDPSRPPAYGWPALRWALYRGLKETGTTHRDKPDESKVVHVIPVVFD